MSANNQNIAGLSKRESTMNDGKSINTDSYGERGSISDESEEEEESKSYENNHRVIKKGNNKESAVKYDDDK